jgi:hypothetical protein
MQRDFLPPAAVKKLPRFYSHTVKFTWRPLRQLKLPRLCLHTGELLGLHHATFFICTA